MREAEDWPVAEADERSSARSTGSGGWRDPARRVLTILVLVMVVAAVGLALRDQDWSALRSATRDRPPTEFALFVGIAFLLNAISVVLTMVSWREMMSGLGERLSLAAALRIFFVGQFAKFVPGKVLGFVVAIRMGKAVGVSAGRMAYAWLLSLVVVMLTGATAGLAAGPEVFGASAAWLGLAAVPIMVVLVRPALLGRAATLAAAILRRPSPAADVSGRGVRRAVLVQLGAWLIGGLHLWVLAVAMNAAPARSFLLCVGAFGLGAVTGMLAVFAPEGIGVREVVLLAALGVALPLPVAGVVVLVSRLVVTLSELTTAGVALLISEIHRRALANDRAGVAPDARAEVTSIRRADV
ncbi:lysylphosphatidylglycerol synthase domain-containing protein [Plantactinospora sp. KBS50]|uniref:lysylphosphatidylglycerol synthase domain-containing protein n=1 Tax=Plantactinospora sp. KBS50 TaxID=2024580 RepID=UPI0012FD154C|nr:lysylphosphatidylglycerol synthase domain-containing protein [Plantactinospora sp. KBS50]